jgi:cytochrome bd-type quinol oxidase subunit 2
MDVNRLSRGEKIAGIGAIALFLIMLIFDWYGVKGAANLGGENAFDAYSLIDWILMLAVIAGVALAATRASQRRVDLPVALSALTTGLAGLGVLLILFRIISPPSFDILGRSIDTSVKIGVFLGLIACAAVAYGGYLAMQEEGTSFGAERDRLSDRYSGGGGSGGSGGTGGPPPPPTA